MRKTSVVLLLGCLLLFVRTTRALADDEADRAVLVNNVQRITVPGGIPGDVIVFGEHAFTIVTGRMGKANLPVFAGARYGSGRVVIGGHEGFFGDGALKNVDNQTFAANIATWLTSGKPAGVTALLIGQSESLKQVLTTAGMRVVDGKPTDIPSGLSKDGLLWLDQAALDGATATIRAVRRWVAAGGHLVVTGPGWGWASIHTTLELGKDQSANQIVMPMGLAFAGGMLDGRRNSGFTIDAAFLPNTSANGALDRLESVSATNVVLPPQELNQITSVLGEALGSLPGGEDGFVRRVAALCRDKGSIIPTKLTPITTSMPFARLKATLDLQQIRRTPVELVRPHPSSVSFPGPVPASAKRVKQSAKVDTSVPEWHGIGLYAPPGEVVTITVPASAASAGLGIRIGAHTDTLWHLDKWERFPEVSMHAPIKTSTTLVSSAFGGTIFIDVPARCSLGVIEVTVMGAVTAPRFVRGVTTHEEWISTLRSAPGPWTELEGRLVILSVPSEAVRDLDDPEGLMAYWDEVLEKCYSFYAAPKRLRPERYCVDREISAGYMHSGYPIMTGDDVAKTFCDVSILRGSAAIKCWGFYHEMGHNFQRPEWTWESFGEVTNNLFSLYGTEMINGAVIGAHPAMTATEMEKRVHSVASSPGAETYYSRDPWYPLTMFYMLKREFGWAPFTKLFAEFNSLPNSARPRTELQKHDQFVERFSRLTGHNLSRYLKAWGVELSPAAEKQVADLPDWMPSDWK